MVTYNLLIHPLKGFPGPRTLAASRIPVTYASLKGIQAQWLHNLHLKYGPVVRVAPNELSFIDEQAWKDIYSSSPTVPQSMKRGSDFFRYLEDDETDHPRIRRAYAPAFSRRALARQEPILAKYGDALVEILSDMEEISIYAICSIIRFLRLLGISNLVKNWESCEKGHIERGYTASPGWYGSRLCYQLSPNSPGSTFCSARLYPGCRSGAARLISRLRMTS